MVKLENWRGVINARKGAYNGGIYTFSHRNPKTGEVWGEDIPAPRENKDDPKEFGMWVQPESVTWQE